MRRPRAAFRGRPRRSASPSSKASSWSCVTRIVVIAERALDLLAVLWRSCARILTSSAPNGSSSRSTCGSVRERAGERDALLLAARDLVLVAAAEAAESDEVEKLVAAFGALGPPSRRGCAGRTRCSRRPSCAGRSSSSGRRSRRRAPAWATARDVAPVETDACPSSARREAGDQAQDRALAAARGAEQHEELALLDLER